MSMIPSPVTPERIEEIRQMYETATQELPPFICEARNLAVAARYKLERDVTDAIRDLLSALSASQAALAEKEAEENVRTLHITEDALAHYADVLRERDMLQAALAAQGQAQGHGKMPESVSVGQREGGGVQIEGHTLAEDWELTLDADGNVELFDRVRVVYKLPAVPGAEVKVND